jgi:hypothetical protein
MIICFVCVCVCVQLLVHPLIAKACSQEAFHHLLCVCVCVSERVAHDDNRDWLQLSAHHFVAKLCSVPDYYRETVEKSETDHQFLCKSENTE